MSYIDTSVIVAALDQRNERRGAALSFFKEEGEKLVSEITLVELASILSRRRELILSIAEKLRVEPEKAVAASIAYVLSRFGLRYVRLRSDPEFTMLGWMSKPFAAAAEIAPRYRLRTLDTLHIAYAMLMREEGVGVESIVTMDKDFLKITGVLEKETGLRIRVLA